MSKRDDDPQTDMEVGMTTAERRRRRRRGGGLRVPSDNVPRTTKPPVVAPVPEDPSLAMSIAYSFSPDAAPEPPRTTTRDSVPTFEAHEGMPTVIDPDPASGPIEPAEFETKTREMTAVDLEALGLTEAGTTNRAIPRQRNSAVELDATPVTIDVTAALSDVRFFKREATDPTDDVEVELDSLDGSSDGGGDALSSVIVDASAGEYRTVRAARIDDASSAEIAAAVDISAEVVAEDELGGDGSTAENVPAMRASSAGEVSVVSADGARPVSEDVSAEDVSAEDVAEDVAAEVDPDDSSRKRGFGPVAHTVVGPVPAPSRTESRGAIPLIHEPSARHTAVTPAQVAAETSQPRTVTLPPSAPVAAAGHEPLQPRPSMTMPPLTVEAAPPQGLTQVQAQVQAVIAQAAANAQASATAQAQGLPFRAARAQTVALSEEDLEEVREAARLASQPVPVASVPNRPTAMSMPPPMPKDGKRNSSGFTVPQPIVEQGSAPEIDLAALEEKSPTESGDFEVDVEGIVDIKSAPVAAVAAAAISAPAPIAPAAAITSVGTPAGSSIGSSAGSSVGTPAGSSIGSSAGAAIGDAAAAAEHRARTPSSPPTFGIAAVMTPSVTSALGPRDSQQMPVLQVHSTPPPTPVVKSSPPSPPPKKDKPPVAPPASKTDASAKLSKVKPWFVELFDEDYLRTLPFLTPQATQAEAEFVINAMGLTPGAQVLDIGCGYGRHAMELAARGFHVVGLDMSTPLLVRGGEEAHRRGLTINFVRGDMRELDFEAQFDGAYCLFSTFGYFDDETNKKTVANIARALRPGGRVLIEILNRDYVIADLPTRVWWEGDGCVVLEEVELNYFSSRIQVNRSVVFDDGRQLEQEISVRAYSLHEVGKLMHAAGFRVLEVSGAYHTRGRFFGNQSRHIIVLAERKDPAAG